MTNIKSHIFPPRNGRLEISELIDNINVIYAHSIHGESLMRAFKILDPKDTGFIRWVLWVVLFVRRESWVQACGWFRTIQCSMNLNRNPISGVFRTCGNGIDIELILDFQEWNSNGNLIRHGLLLRNPHRRVPFWITSLWSGKGIIVVYPSFDMEPRTKTQNQNPEVRRSGGNEQGECTLLNRYL